MEILVVFCHPTRDSFGGSILGDLQSQLEDDGHGVRVIDLYAEGFDPVLRPDEWRLHRQSQRYGTDLDDHVAALREAEGLVFVYPTWWFGLPALLKGWLDRVWQPEVAFAVEDGAFQIHYLKNIKRFAAITKYGSPRLVIEWLAGDPVRRQLMRGLALQFARGMLKCWAPIYNVDARSEADLRRARKRAVTKLALFFRR